MNSKKQLTALLMTAALAGSAMITPTVLANTTGQSIEEQADITNWVANTPQQISNNMAMQHINTNDLNGTKYIVQWGDTLSGISAATGISVAKIAYDNHIQNINLIYAGQTLILNKNGNVPQNYRPQGDPNLVVISKTTINNGPKNVTFVVSPKVTTKNYQSSNGDTTTNNSTTNTTTDNDDDNSSTGTHSHSKHSKSNNSSTSQEDMDKATLVDQLNKAAGKNSDDVSYNAYDDDSDSMKSVDLDDDADEINSLVQKGTKKSIRKAESLIKSHLSDDDDEAYVDYQDGEVFVYTKKKSDKNSSSSDDKDSSSQNDDSDSDNSSNQSQDTNDDYDADEDDD